MRFKFVFRCLLILFVMVSARASLVSAQEVISPEKRIAIRKLIEVWEISRHTSSGFETFTKLYQENWTVTVIANLKAKGLFKRYTPNQATRVENVIKQFSSDMFDEIRRRMRAEVFTLESTEKIFGPIFDKYLSESEINELVAQSQSSSTRKLIDMGYKLMSDAMVERLTEKGVFDVESSPDAEKAKFETLKKETASDPFSDINKIVLNTRRLADETLTPSEKMEVFALANKPVGIKLAQVLPNIAVEAQANGNRLFGPQVVKLTQDVINEQLKLLDGRVSEALRQ